MSRYFKVFSTLATLLAVITLGSASAVAATTTNNDNIKHEAVTLSKKHVDTVSKKPRVFLYGQLQPEQKGQIFSAVFRADGSMIDGGLDVEFWEDNLAPTSRNLAPKKNQEQRKFFSESYLGVTSPGDYTIEYATIAQTGSGPVGSPLAVLGCVSHSSTGVIVSKSEDGKKVTCRFTVV